MTTEVQLFRSGSFESITYNDFEVVAGIHERKAAPTGTIRVPTRTDVSAGQDARIQVNGTTIFDGATKNAGTKRQTSPAVVELEHPAGELFSTQVSLTETNPTDEDVLSAALSAANTNATFTLNYGPTPVSLNNDYDVDNRPVQRVFQDMMDKSGRIWWVDPATTDIYIQDAGGRGLWKDLDAQTDRIAVQSYDDGNVETVLNDVTVVGTGEEAIEGTASDSTSISNYGVRSETFNEAYVTSQAEADDVASSLLIPDPVPEGELLVGKNVGTVTDPQVNKTLDLADASKDISVDGLLIEKQTIRQGRAVVAVGGGAGTTVTERNRETKSQSDVTAPGTVYGNDRLGTDSVDSDQLVDASVIEAKLDDLAVTTQKLQNNAVINGKLADLSVSETKVQDDSISTPKLVAEAVTAAKIEADTITAAKIAAGSISALEIASDTITAGEIEARSITALEIGTDTLTANEIGTDTLTANEIDTLDLSTAELTVTGENVNTSIVFEEDAAATPDELILRSDGFANFRLGTLTDPVATMIVNGVTPANDNNGQVGNSTRAYAGVWAYNFVDASTGNAINDGGDILAGLADGQGPPDFAEVDGGYSLNAMAREVWDVCREQQRTIEDLTTRLSDLEARLDALEDPNA